MRSIAWVFAGIYGLALAGSIPLARADDLHIINEGGRGRGAKAANTGNSNRGPKSFGFFLEPALGFSYGKFSAPETTTATTSASNTLTGPSFSALLGAVYTSYFAGMRMDYQLLSGSRNDFSLGIEAGITLGSSPTRFYGAFNFSDDLNDGSRKFSSNSFIVGLSYFFTKAISANLEYHIRDFGSVTQGGVALKPTFSNFVLTISLPIMFGTPSMPEMARSNSTELKEIGASMGEWNI